MRSPHFAVATISSEPNIASSSSSSSARLISTNSAVAPVDASPLEAGLFLFPHAGSDSPISSSQGNPRPIPPPCANRIEVYPAFRRGPQPAAPGDPAIGCRSVTLDLLLFHAWRLADD